MKAPKIPKAVLEFFKQTGAQGGAAKTKEKAKAARENGKKGGRPKGAKNKPKPAT